MSTTVARLRELLEKATQGRWEHIKRDITLDAVHCLGDPVAVRLYAADAALIAAAVNALPALLRGGQLRLAVAALLAWSAARARAEAPAIVAAARPAVQAHQQAVSELNAIVSRAAHEVHAAKPATWPPAQRAVLDRMIGNGTRLTELPDQKLLRALLCAAGIRPALAGKAVGEAGWSRRDSRGRKRKPSK